MRRLLDSLLSRAWRCADAGAVRAEPGRRPGTAEPNPQLLPTVHAALSPRTWTTSGSRRARRPSPRWGTPRSPTRPPRTPRQSPAALASARQAAAAGALSSLTPTSTSPVRAAAVARAGSRQGVRIRSRPETGRIPVGRGDDRQGGGGRAPRRQAAAADVYEKLSSHKSVAPEDVLSRLGRASLAAAIANAPPRRSARLLTSSR